MVKITENMIMQLGIVDKIDKVFKVSLKDLDFLKTMLLDMVKEEEDKPPTDSRLNSNSI